MPTKVYHVASGQHVHTTIAGWQTTNQRNERTVKMIKVRSREEAWQKANELFPTDYLKDDHCSANAGYPIYTSTMDGNNSWISDLNTSLELNIYQGKAIKTIRISIEFTPEIREEKKWWSSEIRNMCIENGWYTAGDIKAYSDMLEFVEEHEPTTDNIFRVAADILEHTSPDEQQTIENIMFVIANDVVKTFFEIQ